MPFPISFTFQQVPNLFDGNPVSLTINSGLTVFVGPNGAGKTQLLRFLRTNSHVIPSQRGARYISAGRLGFHEPFRSNADGTGSNSNADQATISSSSYKPYRLGSESAIGDFLTLSERTDVLIKVSERLRKLFKRDIFIEWETGSLKVKFKRTDAESITYNSAREASGLLHIVSILTALYNDEVGVLFIDEPEVSLHPQLQAFLRMEMEQVAGDPEQIGKKAIIISTHSTEFIHLRKPEDICNILFFSAVDTVPRQLSLDARELQYSKIRSLLMRMGHSHKTAFFAKRPLLVEGPSDEIICAFLENKLGLYLNAAGSQILPVIGKDQMPVVSKLFQSIGKAPVILMDLDGIADGLSLINALVYENSVEEKVQASGHQSVHTMAQTIYNDYAKLITKYWSELERSLTNETLVEDDKRKRILLKYILNTREGTLSSFSFGNELTSIRNRFVSLLNILEEAGCFILRKGTIEDYYVTEQGAINVDKISKAVLETEHLDTLSQEQISTRYDDVVRALKFAAQSPDINEAEAVSEILLSLASPAISKLSVPNPLLEINNMASRLLLEKASLFKFDIEQVNGENVLVVDKNSTILNVKGFPVRFTPNSNPNEIVKNNIKPD